ncbi:MAG: hypothetical protein L0Y71_22230 [Gemmataceae bacterium]|nr:hypothetical protein [Gemmataceae bacterium]
MELWSDFLNGVLPYQEYWFPLAIGIAVGMGCIFTGNLVWRARKPTPRKPQPPAPPGYDPFLQGSPSEQRKSYRRAGNLVQVLYARPDNKESPRRALVLDRSMGGLRLATDEEVAAGTRLVVLPVNAPELTPWTEIEVRDSSLVEDCWELRCQFLKTPQWSILLLFG